ncbi:DNA polymerase III subunit gamma/tau [Nitrincola tapanii]|uniref:DNA polymerase III subunit gamma/tau n=1 Tax=Nitrincola tapanii TaxID=1708751 RepID=A0A5A9W0B1_9GAMM|nr:DNA polymerase III subunit gamma/tau [Nitrincola tapanii]KAA0874200.1 DNA polymerase III subunit gamma/tau [Nitrincola tapanii]
MSYQVLARKWRPRRFREMVGQEHVLKALVNALDSDRLHHAYLFTGTRGVGKTSIARLFAKALNCEEGVSSEPCGQCTACREIAEGRFVDLIEVDAASRTKVEDTRELLENVQYAPSHGRYKVYLIDEVHMLSNSSFNALLKTLEEPPPHVKFLLATTDPQKLPVTVLSRCLQFNLKNLSPQRIVEHLEQVLTAEEISFDDPALWLLARSADGSMRDALSLTDQAIAFGSGSVLEADVRSMLGSIDQRLVHHLLLALAQGDAKTLLDKVAELSQFTPDYAAVLADLLSLLHRVAMAQVMPSAIDNSLGDQQSVLELAASLSAEDVQLFYQIALLGRKDLPFAADLREGLEMVLLRMLAFRPVQPSAIPAPSTPLRAPSMEAPASPPEQIAQQRVVEEDAASVSVSTPAPAITQPATSVSRAEPATTPVTLAAQDVDEVPAFLQETPPWEPFPEESSLAAARPEVKREEGSAKKSEGFSPAEPEPESALAQAQLAEQAHPSEREQQQSEREQQTQPAVLQAPESASLAVEAIDAPFWVTLLQRLGLSGMTANIARNLSLEEQREDLLRFHFQPEQAALLNTTQQTRIAQAIRDQLGEQVEVVFEQKAQTQETPAAYQQRQQALRKAQAQAALEADPIVQSIMAQFSARLDPASVVALEPKSEA